MLIAACYTQSLSCILNVRGAWAVRGLSQWWIRTLGWCSQSSDPPLPNSRLQSCAHSPETPGAAQCCPWRWWHSLRTPLLLSVAASTPVPLLPIAQHLPVHPRAPSGMEPGSQGSSFALEFLRACGKWGRGSWMLQSFQRNSWRAESIEVNRASQPWGPDSLKHVYNTAIVGCRASKTFLSDPQVAEPLRSCAERKTTFSPLSHSSNCVKPGPDNSLS